VGLVVTPSSTPQRAAMWISSMSALSRKIIMVHSFCSVLRGSVAGLAIAPTTRRGDLRLRLAPLGSGRGVGPVRAGRPRTSRRTGCRGRRRSRSFPPNRHCRASSQSGARVIEGVQAPVSVRHVPFRARNVEDTHLPVDDIPGITNPYEHDRHISLIVLETTRRGRPSTACRV